jgi:hypothetical protein
VVSRQGYLLGDILVRDQLRISRCGTAIRALRGQIRSLMLWFFSQTLQGVREITVEWASTASPMPRFCCPQTFTGVLMKSRLLSSTPQWRRMSYAVVQWK